MGKYRQTCYAAIQDVYRLHLVQHVRARFHQYFATDPYAPLHRLLRGELQKLREQTARRRDAHIVDAHPVDDFDLLDVPHFYNLFDQHYEQLVDPGLSGGLPDKQAVLGYMRVIVEMRNPNAHTTEQDWSRADAERCLDNIRRLAESIPLEAAAKEARRLQEGLNDDGLHDGRVHESPMPRMMTPLLNNLPSAEAVVAQFVGRDKELDELRKWFQNSDRKRWALCGEGGTGKSSLAYRFAQEIVDAAPKLLKCVFWLSAKKRRFLEGEIIPIKTPDFHDLDSALDLLALEYAREELVGAPLGKKRKAILKLLTNTPALLIVDDIDSIRKGESEVVEFFLNDVPGLRSKTKTLITSRKEIFGMQSYTSEVRGLEEAEARQFIQIKARTYGVGDDMLKKSVVEKMIRATGGSPLFLDDLLRLARFIGSRDAVSEWERKRGETARAFALKREFEMLPEDARDLLIAACIQPNAISALEAKLVLDFSDERFHDAIQELGGLFLMQKPTMVRNETRYEVNINVRRLVQQEEASSDAYERIQAAYAANAAHLTGKGRGEVRSVSRQARLMVQSGQFAEAEALLQEAMKSPGRKPVLSSELGWVYSHWKPPRAEDARNAFKQSIALKNPGDSGFVSWLGLELELKQFSRAVEVAKKGLEAFPKSFDIARYAAAAFGARADDLLKFRQREEAAKVLDQSTELYWKALEMEHPVHLNHREVDASMYRGLLHNYRHRHGTRDILTVFSEWANRHPGDSTMALELKRVLRDTLPFTAAEVEDLRSLLEPLTRTDGSAAAG